MRPLPPGAGGGGGGGGPRRKPEHLHLVGPLGDPMFMGSSSACGGGGGGGGGGAGGCGGEGNLGMETVSRVLIPNCKIGAVIGKGGAIIKHIREVRKQGINRGAHKSDRYRAASKGLGRKRKVCLAPCTTHTTRSVDGSQYIRSGSAPFYTNTYR